MPTFPVHIESGQVWKSRDPREQRRVMVVSVDNHFVHLRRTAASRGGAVERLGRLSKVRRDRFPSAYERVR